MAYHSDLQALYSRNRALERELALARAELPSTATSSRLQELRDVGRRERERALAARRKTAEHERRRAASAARRQERAAASKRQRAVRAAECATSRLGFCASLREAAFWQVIVLGCLTPVIVPVAIGVCPLWPLLAILAIIPALSLLGLIAVRRSVAATTRRLSRLPFELHGWRTAMCSELDERPALFVRFASRAPDPLLISDLLLAASSQGWRGLRSMLAQSADAVEVLGSTATIPLAGWSPTPASKRRDLYCWSSAVLELLVELHAEYAIESAHVGVAR